MFVLFAGWSSWSSVDRVFLLAALAGGIGVLSWLALQLVGGETDVDGAGGGHDVSHDVSGTADVSFHWLSFQGLSAFFTMFGLVGLALSREAHAGAWVAIGGGCLAGVGTSWMIGRLFALFRSFQSSGNVDLRSAIGREGTVYLTIRSGQVGKVQVSVGGRLQVCDSVCNQDEPLETGAAVRVVGVANNFTLIVEPSRAARTSHPPN
jgi:hypothetical protein